MSIYDNFFDDTILYQTSKAIFRKQYPSGGNREWLGKIISSLKNLYYLKVNYSYL